LKLKIVLEIANCFSIWRCPRYSSGQSLLSQKMNPV
jgi:hypothetical protein